MKNKIPGAHAAKLDQCPHPVPAAKKKQKNTDSSTPARKHTSTQTKHINTKRRKHTSKQAKQDHKHTNNKLAFPPSHILRGPLAYGSLWPQNHGQPT